MKKSLLLSLVFLACYLPANAQWSLGLQGGYSKAWHNNYYVTRNDDAPLPKVSGWQMLVPVYRSLNRFIQMGVEPGVVQRGMIANSGSLFFFDQVFDPTSSFFPVYQHRFYTTFVQMPVMIKVNAPLADDQLSFFVKGGIGPSWLMAAEAGMDGGAEFGLAENGTLEEIDLKENEVGRWDFGMHSGVGLQFMMGPGQMMLSFDQYVGFISHDFFEYSKGRSYGFSLGYFIELE